MDRPRGVLILAGSRSVRSMTGASHLTTKESMGGWSRIKKSKVNARGSWVWSG